MKDCITAVLFSIYTGLEIPLVTPLIVGSKLNNRTTSASVIVNFPLVSNADRQALKIILEKVPENVLK